MISSNGREEMIAELDDAVETLWKATKIVAPFVSAEGEELLLMLQNQVRLKP